jgi:hypothetical protein
MPLKDEDKEREPDLMRCGIAVLSAPMVAVQPIGVDSQGRGPCSGRSLGQGWGRRRNVPESKRPSPSLTVTVPT